MYRPMPAVRLRGKAGSAQEGIRTTWVGRGAAHGPQVQRFCFVMCDAKPATDHSTQTSPTCPNSRFLSSGTVQMLALMSATHCPSGNFHKSRGKAGSLSPTTNVGGMFSCGS
ncbi:hypothetical protein H310_00205 [Aphanomyces invadans]|uniref:Uncharacterized protein n=1 Tax=Aphanomyces invadans TaxID=157072 RepID=A0A024UUR1_9STRA|nr:hypothetical protein H310_00205 [Aphanomyces invadans]ETW09695.1 hypothetical protein H310_00205 [Aphanomyces invadans]|eukprot:XP_008861106.1 hypothetical protein H310_00205 [Aphanomyces invadans]